MDRVLFGGISGNTGSEPQLDIRSDFDLDSGTNMNAIVSTRIIVTDYNRVSGDNFEVFQREQAPDVIVPQTGSRPGFVGAPVGGLTNQQAWAQFGVAISGAIAPCSNTRPRVGGFVCSISRPVPAGTPPSAVPSPSSSTPTPGSGQRVRR